MIKILHVITLSEIGGAQTVLFNIVSCLHQKDNILIDAACAPAGELVGRLRDCGVKVYEMPELVRDISPAADWLALLKLRRLIAENKYDIVHCHSSKAGIIGRFAAKLAGVPRIIFTVHGWGVTSLQSWQKRILFGFAEKAAGMVSTDIVCVSQADFERGKDFVTSKKMTVIYNGVLKPRGKNGRLRRIIDIGGKKIIIGMAARLKRPKESLFFLETANKLRSIQGLHFVLIGDGPQYGECAQFVKDHSLQNTVHLLGNRADLAELYAGMDIFVLFSSWEGLPMTILEAMMAGLPIVASNVGGVGEEIVDGWNGFLLDELNVEKAAELLMKLASDESLRRRMGENSRRRGEELFSIDRMVREYERLYLKRE